MVNKTKECSFILVIWKLLAKKSDPINFHADTEFTQVDQFGSSQWCRLFGGWFWQLHNKQMLLKPHSDSRRINWRYFNTFTFKIIEFITTNQEWMLK